MATLSNSKQSPLPKEETNFQLDDLVNEAQGLFQVLDDISGKIRDLEKRLNEIKAYFPFSYLIGEDESSVVYALEQRHLERRFQQDPESLGYCSNTCWYLSWEATDENSKNFRLFLLSKLKEVIVWAYNRDPVKGVTSCKPEILFKRPLIEVDLPTRLRFAEHLSVFISHFKEYLRRYRLSIEGQEVGSFDDAMLF